MGRLPTHYNGKRIAFRVPYAMFSECYLRRTDLAVAAGLGALFPLEDFVHTEDKPFEIHRFIPTACAIDAEVDHPLVLRYAAAPQMDYLQGADVVVRDNAKNVPMNRGAVVGSDNVTLANLVRGSAAQTWEWEDPYIITRGEGMLETPIESIFTVGITPDVAIRYMLVLQGFLLVLEGEG